MEYGHLWNLKNKINMKNTIFSLLVLLFSLQVNAQEIERMEPASWWVGMHDPNLQILVYGKDISKSKPSIKYKGIKLGKTHKIENPNYLFIDLEISKKSKPGDVVIEFESQNGSKISKVLKLQERAENSAQRKGFDNSDLMYLITPDRFANGDVNNDNIEGFPDKLNRNHFNGRHGGDLKGISENLDYIKSLGVTAIWSMPLLENNLKEVTYHGYSVSDLYKIDPRFGSNEQYKEIVSKSAQMGIKWIMDIIPNHIGIDHWWMKDLPSKDWINNEGKFKPNSHRREVHQDPYVAEKDKANMVNGWFVPTMPDVNSNNPFVAKYLTQNAIWWVEFAGLGGLRVDTYPYSDKAFLTNWVKAIMDEYPNFNIVGEEWTSRVNTVAYWQKGVKNKDGYVSYLPSLMDFPMQMSLGQALAEEEGFHSGLAKLYATLSDDYLYADPYNLVIFGDNHDMNRFYRQVNGDPKLFKMGLAYLATMRGIPQIYYGTEIGMINKDSEDHGVIREDMPGGWPNDTKNVFKGINLTSEENDFLDFTRKIFNWRKSAEVIHSGKLKHFAPENGIYTYFRYNEKDKVWVILNKGNEPQTLKFSDYSEILKPNEDFTDILDKSTWSKEVVIPAKGFRILEKIK